MPSKWKIIAYLIGTFVVMGVFIYLGNQSWYFESMTRLAESPEAQRVKEIEQDPLLGLFLGLVGVVVPVLIGVKALQHLKQRGHPVWAELALAGGLLLGGLALSKLFQG